MKKVYILTLFLAISSFIYSAEQVILKLNKFGPTEVSKPLLFNDSNQMKRDNEVYFLYRFSLPERSDYSPFEAGKDSVFYLDKPLKNSAFYLFNTNLVGDFIAEKKLFIESNCPYEIYINKSIADRVIDPRRMRDNVYFSKVDLLVAYKTLSIDVRLLASSSMKQKPFLKMWIGSAGKIDSEKRFVISDEYKKRISISDILDGRRVVQASISSDGKYSMFLYANTVPPDGKTYLNYEIVDNCTNDVVLNELYDVRYTWIPNSHKLSYLIGDKNKSLLKSYDIITKKRETLIKNLPGNIGYKWFPDGKSILYSREEKFKVQEPEGLIREISLGDRIFNSRRHQDFYLCNIENKQSQQLTSGVGDLYLQSISNDCEKILFSKTTETPTKTPFQENSFFILDLPSMKIDTILTKQSYVTTGVFSPDAKKILFTGGADSFNGIGLNLNPGELSNSYDVQAYIYDLQSKKAESISRNFNPSIASFIWNKTDGMIYFTVNDKDCLSVYKYNPKKRSYKKLKLLEPNITSFSIAQESLTAVYIGNGLLNSFRGYICNLRSGESDLIADPFKKNIDRIKLGEVHSWSFVSSNNVKIDGRFYLPPHFDPTKKYPLVVYYYGGTSPVSQSLESTFPLSVYAAQDYVVYTLQPSGTIGYGQKFSSLHVNSWGKRTADDIIQGTKEFIKTHPFVDGKKIGCIGASYGGFMTQYLITKTDIFSAAISHAGISSIAGYWGQGYWGYSYGAVASRNSFPWNNKKLYIDQSPLFNADKVKTPLLLLHGTADTNVPTGESMQMYTALKILGKPVELIEVKGENHAITNYKKRIEWNKTIYAWFAKWLKNDSRWWDMLYPPLKK